MTKRKRSRTRSAARTVAAALRIAVASTDPETDLAEDAYRVGHQAKLFGTYYQAGNTAAALAVVGDLEATVGRLKILLKDA